MLQRSDRRIIVEPEEVLMEGLEVGVSHLQTVQLCNSMSVAVDVELKPGPTVDREYELTPRSLRIGARESATVELRVKLLRPQRTGWVIRDIVYIKSEYFDEMFYVSIVPDKAAPPVKTAQEATQERFDNVLQWKDWEINDSQSKVTRLEREVEDLTEELQLVRATLEDKARVEQELVRVQQENAELQATIEELRRNDTYLDQIKGIFRDKAPSLESLIDLTLKQEQEKNERKNAKVLEILQIKDSLIEDLEGRIHEQASTLTALQNKLTDTKVLLSNAENSLKASVADMEELKTSNFEKDQLIRKLQHDLDSVHHKLQNSSYHQSEQEVQKLTEALDEFKLEAQANACKVEQLSKSLDKAQAEARKLREREEYVLELSERQASVAKEHDKVLKEKDEVIAELRAKVSTQSEHIEGLLGKFSQASYHEVLSKVLQLEEENKSLSRQLNESHRQSTFRREDLESSDGQRAQHLEEENLRLTHTLKESKVQWSELEGQLSSKQREIIDLQQQVIALQKASSAPDEQELREKGEKLRRLQQKNHELKGLVSSLEQSNKDLHSDMSNLINRLEHPEEFAHNLTSQTQLVSRLNARIISLKTREEQALQSAARAEQALQGLKTQVEEERSTWLTERNSLMKSTKRGRGQNSAAVQTDEVENDFISFEKHRFEKKLAEFNKEATLYQMKHYEALKDNHDIKEKFGNKIAQHIDELSKLRREMIHLQKKCEACEERLSDSRAETEALSQQCSTLQEDNRELKRKLENTLETNMQDKRKYEEELYKLKLSVDCKEASIQERTAQIAVLMESMENMQDEGLDARLADLTAQLCHAKAVEGNLKKELAEATLEINTLQATQLDKARTLMLLQEKLDTAALQNTKLSQQVNSLTAVNAQLKEREALALHDVQTLNLQLARSNDDEASLKDKLNTYIQQLHQAQKRHAEVLSAERRTFKEALLKLRQDPQSTSGFEAERPLVLAFNQLSMALGAAGKRVSDPGVFNKLVKQMHEVIMECDSALLKSEAKVRDLEFVLKAEVHYKYIDADSIEAADRLVDLVEILAAENTALRATTKQSKDEVYTARVGQLEKLASEKNAQLDAAEKDVQDLKKLVEHLQHKQKVLNEQLLSQEVNQPVLQRELLAKAEQNVKERLRLRDEEVKGYVDTLLSKLALTAEGTRVFDLGREVAELTLENKELHSQVHRLSAERKALEVARHGLQALLKEAEARELAVTVTVVDTSHARYALEAKQSELFKAKEGLSMQKQEAAYLQQQVADLRRELHSVRGLKDTDSQSTDSTKYRMEIADLKEQHSIELENVKTACLLEIQSYKEKLDEEYTQLSDKFKDGEFPGQFKQQNKQLVVELEALKRELHQVSDENARFQSKMDQGVSQYTKLKEDNECLRTIIAELGGGTEPEDKRTKRTLKKVSVDRQPPRGPHKLVRALVAAKIGESEALRKVKSTVAQQKDMREQLQRNNDANRVLEAKLKGLRRYLSIQGVPEPPEEYYLEQPESTDAGLIKRVRDLECEVSQLRLAEASAWGQFVPFSSLWNPADDTDASDDFSTLVDSVIYLAEELAEPDRALAADKATAVEKSQRVVIRTLTRALTGGESNMGMFKPSKEEDRQLWYVELLEAQLTSVHDTIRNLVHFTNQISVEVTGSVSSSSLYKGAAMELAKTTKETSEAIEVINHIATLIKGDLDGLRGADSESSLKERAIIAESMKRKLEDELLQSKMDHNYEATELKNLLESYQTELNHVSQNYDSLVASHNKLQEDQISYSRQVAKLEQALRDAEERNILLQREANGKSQSEKKITLMQQEFRSHQADLKHAIANKDKQVEELHKQLKNLQDEKAAISQENFAMKRTTRQLKGNLEQERAKGEYDEENQQLKRKIASLTEDLEQQASRFKREKDLLSQKVKDLESQSASMKALLKKKKKKTRSNSVGRGLHQREIAEHTHNLELISQRTQWENTVQSLNEQVASLQSQLKEKIVQLDDTQRQRIELQAQVATLEDALESAKSTEGGNFTELADKLEQVTTQRDQLSFQTTQLQKTCEELRQALELKQVQHTELAAAIQRLEAQLKEQDTEHRAELCKAQERTQEALKKQRKAQDKDLARLKTLEADKSTLVAQVQEFQEQVERHKAQLAAAKKETKKVQTALRDCEELLQRQEAHAGSSETLFKDKLEALRQELQATYAEFDKATDRYEAQLSSLKELYTAEIKQRKGKKEAIDYMFQLSKKDALIRSLKNELKTAKPNKKIRRDLDNVEELTALENQLFRQRALNKQLEARVSQLTDELERSQTPVIEESKPARKEFADLERRHKQEMTRLADEVTRIRERWHSPEDWNTLVQAHAELEQALKRANEEVARKRELLDNYKALKDHQESEATALQIEIESIKDMAEKTKRMKLELSRKDKAISDLRSAAEQTRDNERKLAEENAALADKMKSLKLEVTRKDNLVRELRGKLENMNAEAELDRSRLDVLEKLREQLRKAKGDLERKETQLRAVKAKLDSTQTELESFKQDNEKSQNDGLQALEKEMRRSERLQLQLNKAEKQLQALYQVTKRIFKDLSESVEHLRSRFGSSEVLDKAHFSDCMNILNLDLDELSEFMVHGDQSVQSAIQYVEGMLENQDIDSAQVLQVFRKLLDERVELERSGGDVARKYEDYIARMKQEVSKQRKQYESKISQLERKLNA